MYEILSMRIKSFGDQMKYFSQFSKLSFNESHTLAFAFNIPSMLMETRKISFIQMKLRGGIMKLYCLTFGILCVSDFYIELIMRNSWNLCVQSEKLQNVMLKKISH